MPRYVALIAILVAAAGSHVQAQDPGQFQGYYGSSQTHNVGATHTGMINAWGSMGATAVAGQPGNLDAPLYPCPRPDVPREVGGTLITNPALDPHEMLYPHRYRAMYGPYYYKNCGLLPCGSCRCFKKVYGLDCNGNRTLLPHNVRLIGTEVRVTYRGHYAPFSGFFAPKAW